MEHEKELTLIVEKILSNECVFFIGAGISAIGRIYPSTSEINQTILNELFQHPGFEFNAFEKNQLNKLVTSNMPVLVDRVIEVSALHEIKLETSLIEIKKIISKELNPPIIKTNLAHDLLADLKLSAIYTTNYDRSLEIAFKNNGIEPNVYDVGMNAEYVHMDNKNFLPDIIKLYGSAGRQDIVIREQEFDAIVESVSFQQEFNKILEKRTIVFLGYSLTDSSFVKLYTKFSKLYERGDEKINKNHFVISHGNINERIAGSQVKKIHCDALDFLVQIRFLLLQKASSNFRAEIEERKKIELQSLNELSQLVDPTAQINKISEAYNNFKNTYDDQQWDKLPMQDYRFHSAINDLVTQRQEFQKIYFKMHLFIKSTHNESTYFEHKEIYEAIISRRFADAKKAMRKHLDSVQKESIFWYGYLERFKSSLINPFDFKDRLVKWLTDDGKEVNIYDFEKSDATLLLGPGGIGKSTILKRYILKSLVFGKIPVLLDLKNKKIQRFLVENNEGKLFDFIKNYIEDHLPATKNIKINLSEEDITLYFSRALNKGGVTFLIDGLDLLEDQQYIACIKSINKLLSALRMDYDNNNYTMISSISSIYDQRKKSHDIRIEQCDVNTLAYLDTNQIDDYIASVRNGENMSHSDLSHFVGNINTVIKVYPREITFMLLELLKVKREQYQHNLKISDIYKSFLDAKHIQPGFIDFDDIEQLKEKINVYIKEQITTNKHFRNNSDERIFSHPGFVDFLMARNVVASSNNSKILISLVGKTEYSGVLIFAASLNKHEKSNKAVLQELVNTLDAKGIEHNQDILIQYIKNNHFACDFNSMLALFVNIIENYSVYGQIPTKEIAQDFRDIGEVGVDMLKQFLEFEYYNDLSFKGNQIFETFITRQSIGIETERVYGMMRRAAIDSLGMINSSKAQATLIIFLEKYHQKITECKARENNLSDLNEWKHNFWHILIALSFGDLNEESLGKLNFFYAKNEADLDTISKVDILTILYKGTEDGNTFRAAIESEFPGLQKCAGSTFIWERAHHCDTIERLLEIHDAPFNAMLHREFISNLTDLAKNDGEHMVRYYAITALGKLYGNTVLGILIEILNEQLPRDKSMQEMATGWVTFAILNSLELTFKKYTSNIDILLIAIRKFIQSFSDFSATTPVEKISKIHLSAVGKAVKILGLIGERNIDVELLDNLKNNLLRGGEIYLLHLGSLRFIIDKAKEMLNAKKG